MQVSSIFTFYMMHTKHETLNVINLILFFTLFMHRRLVIEERKKVVKEFVQEIGKHFLTETESVF